MPFSVFFLFGGDVVIRMKYSFPIAQGLLLYFLVQEIVLAVKRTNEEVLKSKTQKVKKAVIWIAVCGFCYFTYRNL